MVSYNYLLLVIFVNMYRSAMTLSNALSRPKINVVKALSDQQAQKIAELISDAFDKYYVLILCDIS